MRRLGARWQGGTGNLPSFAEAGGRASTCEAPTAGACANTMFYAGSRSYGCTLRQGASLSSHELLPRITRSGRRAKVRWSQKLTGKLKRQVW